MGRGRRALVLETTQDGGQPETVEETAKGRGLESETRGRPLALQGLGSSWLLPCWVPRFLLFMAGWLGGW